jgi:UDP-glucose-4-epimerase GalE
MGEVILVSGGAGYIGAHTVLALQEAGFEVLVLDDFSEGHRAALRGTPYARGSLLDRQFVQDLFARHAIAGVVHFAARCYVGESVERPGRYYENNVGGTLNLLDAMVTRGCRRIVFSSTCAIYGEPESVPIVEEARQLPVNPYGNTKLVCEFMLRDFARAHGLGVVALRYFNAAGAAQEGDLGEEHDPETHLIPLVLQVALGKRKEIQVFGDDYPTPDGTCIRDYVHVEDLARAHLAALVRLQQGRSPILVNLGTGTGYTVLQVIEAARRVTGHPIPVRVVPRRAGDPPELVCGGTLARELLGWSAQRAGLDDIVRDAWRFLSRS